MNILAIESSCDETSAAVVRDGRVILSNLVLSQIETHRRYGGVVPEIASRAHVEAITPLVRGALEKAGLSLREIDAVAVTYKPGLIGALLVGVNFAKSLAYAADKPLVAVNHIRGHVAANYLSFAKLTPPFLALVVSGGHTSLLRVDDYTSYHTVGITRDDAAGEAFDKVARVMGLPYPGGAEMDRLAAEGDAGAVLFPKAVIRDAPFDFSFSGLKTAVINHLHHLEQTGAPVKCADIAASFTRSVVESLESRVKNAMEEYGCRTLVLAGGVSANSHIRRALRALAERRGGLFYVPPLPLCADNAAMIASQAFYEYTAKRTAGLRLNAVAQNTENVD